jgi:lipid II:glycine glycyltransferase (peptidoglycan interpeptide bridge formation enzyme)
VYLNGKMVGSSLVFRDRTTAHSQLAAFDAKHRHAAVFLHWHAMRDMYRMGARRYNLGPAPGSLARFKQQFCEHPVSYPGAITVVLKQGWFKVWQKAIFPVARGIRPTLRTIVSNIKR